MSLRVHGHTSWSTWGMLRILHFLSAMWIAWHTGCTAAEVQAAARQAATGIKGCFYMQAIPEAA